ncbi:MAG: hypothetical protein ACREC6_08900 [Hyphomicrobiaceae bacterium]
MPIVGSAPWRHRYFARAACPENVWIPTDDPEAWDWNPKHRWVYDKLQVAVSQDVRAAPHGVMPPHFPVFSKPIVNLRGMGIGSRIVVDAADYERHHAPGHMWMVLLEGRHISTDMAVVAGEPKWIRHATGKPMPQGTFDYWTVHARPFPQLDDLLSAWVRRHLVGYTGMLNFESIGGTIIEVHLRFADQWPDLYGAGWVEALIGLYRDKAWRFAETGRRDGYSVALFYPHGFRYRHPPRALVEQVLTMPGISSVQTTFHEDRDPALHAMPPGGFRVALVNCLDLAAGQAARKRLAEWFENSAVGSRQSEIGRKR